MTVTALKPSTGYIPTKREQLARAIRQTSSAIKRDAAPLIAPDLKKNLDAMVARKMEKLTGDIEEVMFQTVEGPGHIVVFKVKGSKAHRGLIKVVASTRVEYRRRMMQTEVPSTVGEVEVRKSVTSDTRLSLHRRIVTQLKAMKGVNTLPDNWFEATTEQFDKAFELAIKRKRLTVVK